MAKQTLEGADANHTKGWNKPLILCIVAIVALCGVVTYLLLSKDNTGSNNQEDSTKRNVVVSEQNAKEVASEMLAQEYTPTGYYQVTMNSTWNFASGDAVSDNAYVENATANTNAVYFDVVRSDTEETIYESPVIPVGSHLENISLDKDLEAGTYDCVLTYHLVDDDQKTLSTLNMGLTIVIAQ
jgi:hypothetical protein